MKIKNKSWLILVSITFSLLFNLNNLSLNASETNVTSVDGGNEIINKTITGRVDLHKQNKKGEPLSGAEFTIYDDNGELVDVLTTNKYGYTRSYLLDYGAYSVVETKAPIGYQLTNDVYNFHIITDGETVHLNDGNPIINNETVSSNTDEEGKLYIVSQRGAGSKYEIYDEDGNLVDTVIIDENGKGSSVNLPYGNYCVQGGSSDFCFELSSSNQYQVYVDGTEEKTAAATDEEETKEQATCVSNTDSCSLEANSEVTTEQLENTISTTGSSNRIIIYVFGLFVILIGCKMLLKRN